jgi:regulator of RNase E activity RraA
MMEPGIEPALIMRAERLYTAVVSDILDGLGHRDQVMAPRIRPLDPEAKIVGVARTVRAEPVDGPPLAKEDNYRLTLAAIESMGTGHVMIVSEIQACFWGELLSLASLRRGARGIVIDGYTRDTTAIVALGFPTFCSGIHAADALGRVDVVEFGGQITSGGVSVDDGDLVIGDNDGVVTVPAAIAGEVVRLAEEKIDGENLVRTRLDEGMAPSEAYRRFGVL